MRKPIFLRKAFITVNPIKENVAAGCSNRRKLSCRPVRSCP